MREYLFRGKRKDNGEWVEGSLVAKVDLLLETSYYFILAQGRGESFVTWHMVDPATVGQFTGLMDKNGKRIFEGDMLKPFDDEIDKMVVEFHCGAFMLCLYGERGYISESGDWCDEGNYGVIECEPLSSYGADIEVIGNIHDNPELVEGVI